MRPWDKLQVRTRSTPVRGGAGTLGTIWACNTRS